MDSECYPAYYLVMLQDVETRELWHYEITPDGRGGTSSNMPAGTWISFNGNNYDMPILALALAGADNATLKAASDDIILRQLKPWNIAEKYGGHDLSGIDHIDLIEVAPGQASLKVYGGRLHSRRLQDLPFEPDHLVSVADQAVLRKYCGNDLQTTEDLYRYIRPQLELRESMSAEFGIDLRSKSDAQIAEAVIRSEVEKQLGRRIYRPEIHPGYKFRYNVPRWIAFNSPGMKHALNIIREAEFSLDANGAVEMPRILESMRLRIGAGVYRMGIGGLHSSESCVRHLATDQVRLVDRDVASYYPSLILTQGLYPSHMGEVFLAVYGSLVARRLAAKKRGDKVMNEALKVVINGSFGKFGSKWSVLYSPDLMIQVTLGGQLALLMLIEAIEDAGIPVISANTDGIVTACPIDRKPTLDGIISAWELISGLTTEETEYSRINSRDVNNYLALTTDGEFKQKGVLAFVGSKKSELEKNPTNYVCVDAVMALLRDGVTIEQTIYECTDIRRFLSVRAVKGGAVYDGQFLGKAVRWYYARDEKRHISYHTNGNMVPRSEGARPMMELVEGIPADLDYDWYVREAKSILADIGETV